MSAHERFCANPGGSRDPAKAKAWVKEWTEKHSSRWRMTHKGLVPADGIADPPLRVQNLIPNVLAHIEYEFKRQSGSKLVRVLSGQWLYQPKEHV